MGKTTIQVDDETWSRLDELKDRGESFDEVINRELDAADRQREVEA